MPKSSRKAAGFVLRQENGHSIAVPGVPYKLAVISVIVRDGIKNNSNQ